MADANTTLMPLIDIVQRGDDLLIRTEADVRPEDVRVDVHDGMLEVRVPRSALRMREVPRRRSEAMTGTTAPGRARDESTDAEPPLGYRDEQDLWNAQRPLISEDRRTSIHLEGFTDEQAESILEVMGDDAPEEAQGGSATGSDAFPAHGGFPARGHTDEEEGEEQT